VGNLGFQGENGVCYVEGGSFDVEMVVNPSFGDFEEDRVVSG
jgi:hypothetical protein